MSEGGPNSLVQPLRFGIVGVVNTGVDLAVFWLLLAGLQAPLLLANTLSYACGIACSFLLNRLWTFRGIPFHHSAAAQAPRFLLVSLIGLLISNAVIWVLVPMFSTLAAKLSAVVATFAWNFTASKFFVFAGKGGEDIGW
jgi:putative flippase GtrA